MAADAGGNRPRRRQEDGRRTHGHQRSSDGRGTHGQSGGDRRCAGGAGPDSTSGRTTSRRPKSVYRAVIATRRGTGPPGLGSAKALVDQASMQFDRENLAGAEPLLRDAVEIQRRLAPGSVVLARSLTSLGNVMRARDNFKAAAPLLREGADTLERLVPDTADFAVSLNNLGQSPVAAGRGRSGRGSVSAALSAFSSESNRRARRPRPASWASASPPTGVDGWQKPSPTSGARWPCEERLAPGTANEARVLNNLGSLLLDRGELLAAEEFLRSRTGHSRADCAGKPERCVDAAQHWAHSLRQRGDSDPRRGLPQTFPRAQGTPGAWRRRLGDDVGGSWKPRQRPRRPRDGRNLPATRAGSPGAAGPAQPGSGHTAQQPRECGHGSRRPGRCSRAL